MNYVLCLPVHSSQNVKVAQLANAVHRTQFAFRKCTSLYSMVIVCLCVCVCVHVQVLKVGWKQPAVLVKMHIRTLQVGIGHQ